MRWTPFDDASISPSTSRGSPWTSSLWSRYCALPMSAESGLLRSWTMALARIYIGQKDDAIRMTAKRMVHQSHNFVRGIRP